MTKFPAPKVLFKSTLKRAVNDLLNNLAIVIIVIMEKFLNFKTMNFFIELINKYKCLISKLNSL
jgi:hypothetical protein